LHRNAEAKVNITCKEHSSKVTTTWCYRNWMAMMVIIVVVVYGNVDTDINQTNTSAVTEMTP